MEKIYVLHHDDNDGYASALALYQIYEDGATYIPVQYGQKFPDIEIDKNTTVYIVDFSYDRATLENVHSKVKMLLVLDHHETAEEDLKGLPYAIYYNKMAGATLCWVYFHPGKPIPYMFQLVEDYDLYKFLLKDTRSFNYGMKALGYDKDLKKWVVVLNSQHVFGEVLSTGDVLKEEVDNRIKKFKDRKSYKICMDSNGLKFALYNTGELINELAESLYRDEELALDYTMSYFFTREGEVVFSLRSNKDNPSSPKVNTIAKELANSFGEDSSGGGHKNAAGCHTSFSKGVSLLALHY